MVTTPHKKITLQTWQPETWEDFVDYCENSPWERTRVFYNQGLLWVDMGHEGLNHASVNQLFSMLFCLWFANRKSIDFMNVGGCVLEKPKQQGAAPDIALYVGDNFPQWKPGEPRRVNLNQWRVPDLVGEVSDTTLATDLDEKKHLYAALKIPEYWVIDVMGSRLFAFRLTAAGSYEICEQSEVLEGLSITVLNQALERLKTESNGRVALWFAQQLSEL